MDETPHEQQRCLDALLTHMDEIRGEMSKDLRLLRKLLARVDERRKQDRGEDGFDG